MGAGSGRALGGFHWGRRFDHSWRSKRGIVLGGGASLRDKLTVKAEIEAVVGVHGLIAFYVADDAEGDKSYLGADGAPPHTVAPKFEAETTAVRLPYMRRQTRGQRITSENGSPRLY